MSVTIENHSTEQTNNLCALFRMWFTPLNKFETNWMHVFVSFSLSFNVLLSTRTLCIFNFNSFFLLSCFMSSNVSFSGMSSCSSHCSISNSMTTNGCFASTIGICNGNCTTSSTAKTNWEEIIHWSVCWWFVWFVWRIWIGFIVIITFGFIMCIAIAVAIWNVQCNVNFLFRCNGCLYLWFFRDDFLFRSYILAWRFGDGSNSQWDHFIVWFVLIILDGSFNWLFWICFSDCFNVTFIRWWLLRNSTCGITFKPIFWNYIRLRLHSEINKNRRKYVTWFIHL